MKRIVLFAVMFVFAAICASAETWQNASVVDKMCATKAKADLDKHTRACALQCKGSGFGILTNSGEFLAFDSAGNEKTATELQSTNKKDHLRATVKGTRDGNTIKVEQVTLD
jgi:hypothetical protein